MEAIDGLTFGHLPPHNLSRIFRRRSRACLRRNWHRWKDGDDLWTFPTQCDVAARAVPREGNELPPQAAFPRLRQVERGWMVPGGWLPSRPARTHPPVVVSVTSIITCGQLLPPHLH